MKNYRSVKVIEIIAQALNMPKDVHLNEVLAALFSIDKNNEIRGLLIKAGVMDMIESWKAEGIIN